jgi:hypothetical protein
MKFFFPDSQDQVDPSFDFVTEERSSARMRHRDDEYAHEVFKRAPFDGVLVSKAVLDSGRYSLAQKHRMLRSGVRDFFRITDPALQTMGDCGAFAYVREDTPPFSVAEVVEFYQTMGFDYGMSVDHIILGYEATDTDIPTNWIERQGLTLKLAEDFLARHSAMGAKFTPIGGLESEVLCALRNEASGTRVQIRCFGRNGWAEDWRHFEVLTRDQTGTSTRNFDAFAWNHSYRERVGVRRLRRNEYR